MHLMLQHCFALKVCQLLLALDGYHIPRDTCVILSFTCIDGSLKNIKSYYLSQIVSFKAYLFVFLLQNSDYFNKNRVSDFGNYCANIREKTQNVKP